MLSVMSALFAEFFVFVPCELRERKHTNGVPR